MEEYGTSAKNFDELTPKPRGFIEEYSNFLLSNVPTSSEWAEDLALSVLSTVVGPKMFVSTHVARLRLNVWHIFVGPSGLSYKTIPMRDYVIPTLRKYAEMTGRDVILPSSFSMEGLIEYMKEGHNEGIIIRDEVSTLFKEVKGAKNYNIDLIEFLSQLYDGTVQKRYTRKAKLEEVLHCYVVFVGASTPYLYRVLDPDVFVQGLGNRVLFDFWDGGVKTFTGNELFYNPKMDYEREAKIVKFARELAELPTGRTYFLSPEPERASAMLAEFKAKMDKKASLLYKKDPTNLKSSYLARMGELAIKVAGLAAVSRTWKLIPKSKVTEIPVMPQDVEWAIYKIERHIENFERLLNDWTTMPVLKRPVSYKLTKEAFINAIKNSPDGIKTQEELLNELGWYKCDLYYQLRQTILDDPESGIRLMTEEELEALPDHVKRKHNIGRWKGKPPVVFIVKDELRQ